MKFNNLKRTLLFVFAAVSICICMFEVCSASEKGKDQVSALQYFPEDSDIICYGDMSALGKMPTLVDFYKGILKSIVQPDKYEKFEKAFSDQRRYSGTSALTIDVSKDSGIFFMKIVSLFDSSDAAEESFKGVFKSKETMMALQIQIPGISRQ